jgi:stringent starvation protein B
MIRAVYEWCADAGYTPYLAVKVNAATRVPSGYVKNGEIVLNISHAATRDLTISNELIQFSARFGGVSHEIAVPVQAVAGIFARENGKGMFFEIAQREDATLPREAPAPAQEILPEAGDPAPEKPLPGKPRLTVVK